MQIASSITGRIAAAVACRWLPVLLAVSLFCAAARAQEPSRYRYYHPYDSTFRITGTNISNWEAAQELRLDYVRLYQSRPADFFSRLIADTSAADRWTITQRRFYAEMLAHSSPSSVKVITPIDGMGVNLKNVRVVENYARVNPVLFHNLEFGFVGNWGRFDTVMHGIAIGVTAPGGSREGREMLMASAPRYLSQWAMFEGDSAIYAAHPALSGSFTSFRVSCTMRADSLDEYGTAGDDLLAYFVVLRRVRGGQRLSGDGSARCACSAYAPIDTLFITRRTYEQAHAEGAAAPGYREVGRRYDLAVPNGTADWPYDSTVYIMGRTGAYDSVAFRRRFFEKDTVTGTFLGEVVMRDETANGRRVVVRGERIRRTLIALRRQDPKDWLHGDGWDWFGAADCRVDTCRARLARGLFGADAILDPDIYSSDLDIRFYSTGRVPVTFLRSRVNQDLYDHLRSGELDSMLFAPAAARMYANDTLLALLGRLAYSDETFVHKYRGDGAVARRLQDVMHAHGDTLRELWCNPVGNFDAFRVLTEDLDTSRLRTIQLMVRQDYNQIGGVLDGIPVFYADPDSMSDFALRSTFPVSLRVVHRAAERARPGSAADTLRMDCITPNTPEGYRDYTMRRQFGAVLPGSNSAYCSGWGSFRESFTVKGTMQGGTVTTLARAVTAAKVRYRDAGPPVQVWNSVQGMGWRVVRDPKDVRADTAAIYPAWSSRPATPEEITCQGWLSLNCGVDGLVYTDAQIDAANWGYVEQVTGRPAGNYGSWLPQTWVGPTHADTLKVLQPRMWTGFLDRYNAVKRMNDEIRLLDPIVHFTTLRFAQEQISVHDTAQTFREMPWIDTLMAERSVPFDTSERGAIAFRPGGTFDARGETFIELTHFGASPLDTARGAHYFIITNRRTWPVDNRRYGQRAQARGAQPRGLGAIDVRRPWIRLRADENPLVDSVIVEKVGHDAEWPPRRVAVGQLVALDWLTPGWGAVYRVRPIVPAARSGTAYAEP
ncbi:MAG: hypothetical protein JST22_12880 [Bacteroidetes bacterium]|nr:hypothetical protein [Bacteroidota bacterium]